MDGGASFVLNCQPSKPVDQRGYPFNESIGECIDSLCLSILQLIPHVGSFNLSGSLAVRDQHRNWQPVSAEVSIELTQAPRRLELTGRALARTWAWTLAEGRSYRKKDFWAIPAFWNGGALGSRGWKDRCRGAGGDCLVSRSSDTRLAKKSESFFVAYP